MSSNGVYKKAVKKVLRYLSKVTAATPAMILEPIDIKPHDIRRMINDKILTTSLNYNHNWLIVTKEIRKRRNHWGFYKHRIKKHSRTVPIFHIKRTAKATLSYLASRRPWGINIEEATKLLGRDCKRVFNQLVEENAIQERLYKREKIYINRIHKKAELQLNHRRTNPKFKKEDEEEEDKIGVIRYEEFCKVFQTALNEMENKPNISDDRITAILMMFNTNRTLRTTETWIRYNSRIKEAIGMPCSLDHTTFSRIFKDINEDFLKKLFHKIVMKLHNKGVITGRFLVVDATHIYAYCNTRKDTNKYPVEGAEWGNHHGSFYGYKIHILIDSESEMPLAMILSPGNDYDSPHFIPLIEDFYKNYDFDETIAVLADGAYDVTDFRKIVLKKTGGVFLPACNPRKSKILKMMKLKVKELFDKYGDRIQSVQDAFKYLGQRFLTDFNIDLCSLKQNKLVELVSERLHRHFRSAVERVFSRLKAMVAFERPKSRRPESVIKTIWWCLIGHVVHALTAYKLGLPGSMRKRTMLV